MGISIWEFQVAMETFGAKRLPDCRGSRYNILVPCYEVAGFCFYHSGSYYITNNVPREFIDEAMAKFNEEYPGKDNFWYGEVHSVKGILTLACILENRYTEELVKELLNETYKKLLDMDFIKTVPENNKRAYDYSFMRESTAKLMEELCRLIDEFDSLVNPFTNTGSSIKEPKEYMDKIKLSVANGETRKLLHLSTELVQARYVLYSDSSSEWNYDVTSNLGQLSGYTVINHFYRDDYWEDKNHFEDEILYLFYTESDIHEDLPENIDLRISLKTGMAWKTYHEEKVKIATQKEIKIMIRYLKRMIGNIKIEIISNMLKNL